MPDLLSAGDLDRRGTDGLLAAALGFERRQRTTTLAGAIVAMTFFEQSLRTRVGFEVAAMRLGATTVAILGAKHLDEMSAPESLADTIRMLGDYCDAICLRHPDSSAPFDAAQLVELPVINCGNGIDEHPTQALIDVFAIRQLFGEVDGRRIALVGDLRHMRSAHSLLTLLALYDVEVRCISPANHAMPPDRVATFVKARGGAALEETDIAALDDVDVVYIAGFPARQAAGDVSWSVRERFAIDGARARRLPARTRILCPLPRVDEISVDVDALPSAGYFRQSALGLPMRMAVLEHVLGADRAPA